MASLSDLPPPQRRLALRLSYLSYLALFLGALGAIFWVRKALPLWMLPIALLLLAVFVAFELWFPFYVRRLARAAKER